MVTCINLKSSLWFFQFPTHYCNTHCKDTQYCNTHKWWIILTWTNIINTYKCLRVSWTYNNNDNHDVLYQDLELWLLLTRRFQYARTTTRSEHVVRAFQLGNFACPQPCDFLRHRSEQLVPRKSEAGAVIEQFTDRLVNIIQHYFFQTFVIASFNLFSIITIYTSHLYYYFFFRT